jgi:polyisoprenoid-binding protein YceI
VDVDTESLARSHVRLTIAAADLKVSPQGEPADDVPKVQETMDGEKVLDVRRHPEITFDSTSVTVKEQRGDAADLVVAGRLAIRGVTQVVSIPVHVTFGRQGLSATGRFAVKQSAFGITPISVAGVVSVKDLLEIEFSVSADK